MHLMLTQKTIETVKDQVNYVAALYDDKDEKYEEERSKLFVMDSLLETMGIIIEYKVRDGEENAKVKFSLKTEIDTERLPAK